ncbi:MAG: hypothetical protein LAP21_02510 [Acidobacteriia bacterium]|nr:hypothetical protein [Terriglobia bacterium]
MTHTRQTERKAFPQWVAVACILIALLFAGLEATHVHESARSGNVGGPCAVCISAHANAPTATVTAVPAILMVAIVAIPYEIEANSITNLLDIFIRPPPCA